MIERQGPRSRRLVSALLATAWLPLCGFAGAIEAEIFDDAVAAAERMPRLRSMLVSHDQRLVLERYFNGTRPHEPANVKSVSKTIISALVGIAIEQGHIAGIDQSIADFYDELLADEPQKRSITVGNLLSMQAGLETTSFYNYGAWVMSDDWIRFALAQPFRAAPGTRLVYSTGNTHLLSGIITRATKRSTLQFARQSLTEPLGFELEAWPRDPNGIYFGGNNMELTPRQMLAFGEMYLNGGKVGSRQVVPREWVARSTEPRVRSRRDATRQYGYGWWIKRMAGFEAAYAWGYGGQFIMLVPELSLVVVTTSSSRPGDGRRSHIRGLYRLLEDEIVKAAASAIIRPPLAPGRNRMTLSTD